MPNRKRYFEAIYEICTRFNCVRAILIAIVIVVAVVELLAL